MQNGVFFRFENNKAGEVKVIGGSVKKQTKAIFISRNELNLKHISIGRESGKLNLYLKYFEIERKTRNSFTRGRGVFRVFTIYNYLQWGVFAEILTDFRRILGVNDFL